MIAHIDIRNTVGLGFGFTVFVYGVSGLTAPSRRSLCLCGLQGISDKSRIMNNFRKGLLGPCKVNVNVS